MNTLSGSTPICTAKGNRTSDVDDHEYIYFALGDTDAMAGYPVATTDAVRRRIETLGGITTMMPTADAEPLGGELAHRFGMPLNASRCQRPMPTDGPSAWPGIIMTPFHNMALMPRHRCRGRRPVKRGLP